MTAQVLIIEDEAILARNLAASLARHGVTSDVASSLADATHRLASATYALVCSDIRLADGDGLEFCSKLRRDFPHLPLVMMTGQDSVDNRLRSEGVGATAFVAKPFSLSRVRELIATLLQEVVEVQRGSEAARGPRVLMYSHDTIGLGHMRRNSAIAARIVDADPRASVLMLVGSPSGVPFDLPPGVDYLKLPSVAKVARDVWRPQSLRVSGDEVISLRSALIERAVQSFAPDVFLVDHEAGGVRDELVPAFEALRRSRRPVRIVLGLRDILDEPQLTRQSWAKRGTADIVRRFYDDILVYGDESVFPSRLLYGLDGLAPGRVWSCGYVTHLATATGANVPADRGAPARIVVAGGGGRDAFPLLAAAVEALCSIPAAERPEADVIAGPLMDADLRQPLELRAVAAGLRFHRSHPDPHGLLARADLFVTMGGYNSVIEAIAIGCPTLVVPRVGPSAEQRMRATCLARLGLVQAIDLDQATPAVLAALFREPYRAVPRREAAIDLDGANRAAAHIRAAIASQFSSRDGGTDDRGKNAKIA